MDQKALVSSRNRMDHVHHVLDNKMNLKNLMVWLFPTVAESLHREGYERAIKDILIFKDKIYTKPVTLRSKKTRIQNCTFLGNEVGLKIKMP